MTPQRDVLVLTTAYDPFIGGAELATREVMRRIPGVHFTVLTARFLRSLPHTEVQGNITIVRLGLGTRFDKLLLPLLAYREARRRATAHTTLWCVMVSYAALGGYYVKRRMPHVRLVLTLQEGDVIEGRKFGLVPFWWKRLLSVATDVHSISTYLADLAKTYGYTRTVHVIPNGVDVELFSRRDEVRISDIRAKHHLDHFDFVLISVSRLVEKNGLADVICALPQLPGVGFIIVGEGSLRSSLTTLASSLGVLERVIFVGSVPLEEVPHYLRAAHAFIRLSKSEGLGTAFIEAMAAGLPVIATSVGGIPDVVRHGRTGLLMSATDPQTVRGAVQSLMDAPDFVRQLGNSAATHSAEHYRWETVASAMEQILCSA